jgi:hypothetical protein
MPTIREVWDSIVEDGQRMSHASSGDTHLDRVAGNQTHPREEVREAVNRDGFDDDELTDFIVKYYLANESVDMIALKGLYFKFGFLLGNRYAREQIRELNEAAQIDS